MRKKQDDQRGFAARSVVHIRTGAGASRKELAKVMDISPSTAGLYVDQLIEAGYVMEVGLKFGAMGRPKRHLEVRPEAGWFIGVEWNGNRLNAVRVDFAGEQLGQKECVFSETIGADDVLAEIEKVVTALIEGVDGQFLGIGLGAPGVVDPWEGTASDFAFIKEWQKVPLKARVQERFSVPVTVGNNLRVIAMAERWFGGAAGMENFVIVGPRSGFGVAVVIQGELLGGVNAAAGEVGNWVWKGPGGETELHHALSAPAVWRRLTGAPRGAAVPTDLREVMENISARLDDRWEDVAKDFATVIGQLHLLLDSGTYFVHGPLCGLGKAFWDQVMAHCEGLMPRLATRLPKVQCTTLMDDAGALGAASLAMESWLPTL
jgi:predicted NBD/HSP70 family sugar kinase